MKVEEFTLHLRAGGTATDDMRHNFQLRITAHDGCHDSHRTRTLGQGVFGIGAVSIGHILYLVTVAGDIDKRRGELHQRVNTVIEATYIAAF